MPQIDLNYTKLFTRVLRQSEIYLIAVPTSKPEKHGADELLKKLDNGFNFGNVVVKIPAGIDDNGDLNVLETNYIMFGDVVGNIEELNVNPNCIHHVKKRPEAILVFWQITLKETYNATYYIFKDLTPVDLHIFKLPGVKEINKEREEAAKINPLLTEDGKLTLQ
jgi:hypothetical protein